MSTEILPVRSHAQVGETAVLFGVVFGAALILTLGLRPWGFVHHDTSEVVMWGNSGWAMGFWKHPPLLPWLTRAWSLILPMGALSLSIITALNMTLCAWAVWQISRLSGAHDSHAVNWLTLLLLAVVPYATFMAIKLNHNSILVSLWPLTTLAFLSALDRPTVVRGVLFGIAAVAAVMAKYYSLLLLAGCLAASIATPARAFRFYRSPAPYVCMVVFMACTAPHILWLVAQPASPVGYAFAGGVSPAPSDLRGALAALSFAAQTPLVLAPLALVAALLWRHREATGGAQSHAFERELIVLAVVPYALTAVVVTAFNLHGPVAWAMPIFLCLPAVVAARLGRLHPGVLQRLGLILAIALTVAALVGQIGVRIAISRGTDGVSDPRAGLAQTATEMWRAATGRPLAIVGGDPRLTSGVVVFSVDRPQGWPSFNPVHAPWVTPRMVAETGFVGLCRRRDGGCIDAAEQAGRQHAVIRCDLKLRVEYLGASGPAFEAVLFMTLPLGQAVPVRAVACPAE
jgi:Dolichyl-phosphate-mannose-protein mannosyltransferase